MSQVGHQALDFFHKSTVNHLLQMVKDALVEYSGKAQPTTVDEIRALANALNKVADDLEELEAFYAKMKEHFTSL